MSQPVRRGLLVAQGWIQAVVIVVLCGFLILGILAYRTYTDEPPIPSQVVDSTGQVLFMGTDVMAGQEVFLRNGLMEYGSIFGHGAYLGPDFTADYLHRAALIVTSITTGTRRQNQPGSRRLTTSRRIATTASRERSPIRRRRRRRFGSLRRTTRISWEPPPANMACGRPPSAIRIKSHN